MRQVTGSAVQVQRLSNEVNAGSEEQARAIEQISKAILQIQQVTQQTAASAEEGASAGAQMSDEAEHLQSAVNRMRAMLGMHSDEDQDRSRRDHPQDRHSNREYQHSQQQPPERAFSWR